VLQRCERGRNLDVLFKRSWDKARDVLVFVRHDKVIITLSNCYRCCYFLPFNLHLVEINMK